MYKVSDATKAAFRNDGTHKEFTISFPSIGLTIGNSGIVSDSIQLNESIQTGTDIQFVGCIASTFTAKLYSLTNKVMKGTKVVVYVQATDDNGKLIGDRIPLFNGRVETVERDDDRDFKTIEAYDDFYRMSQVDISDWYNNHEVGMTLEQLLVEIMNNCGVDIEYEGGHMHNASLPVHFGTYRTVSNMSILDLVKNICQINGAFGRINRKGNFELVYHRFAEYEDDWQEKEEVDGREYIYPDATVFPDAGIFPGLNPDPDPEDHPEPFDSIYETIRFEDYEVNPIDYITIRDSSDDEGHNYPELTPEQKTYFEKKIGNNKYIVQGNLFAFDREDYELENMAYNIWYLTRKMVYRPFRSSGIGLPYVECGDLVKYTFGIDPATQQVRYFYIFDRTLKGDQKLTDEYQAEGEEFRNEFISDVSISTTVKKDDDGLQASSVEEVPEDWEENHIYFLVEEEY